GKKLLYRRNDTFLSPKTGQPISDFPYEKLDPFKYGERLDLALVYRDEKTGLIDTTSTERLPCQYDQIETMHDGRMAVEQDNRWVYADAHFRIRIPPSYDHADYFQYRLTTVEKDKKKGVINRNGREVIPLRYDQLSFD